MFKSRVPTGYFLQPYRDQCVQCAPGRIKPVSGDDPALCQEVCNGTTNVANAEQSALW